MSAAEEDDSVTVLVEDDDFEVFLEGTTLELTVEVESAVTVMLGSEGPRGLPGAGVAAGGTTGQVLRKASNTDYDTEWRTLSKSDVGLSNVDNTSDADKPISDATQFALDLKADLNSPTFTGTPRTTTPAAADNSTRIADTAWVNSEILRRKSVDITGYARTIALMRDFDVAALVDGQLVEVAGYAAANDGGGGTFCWNAASTSTPDSGTIFQPTAGGTGRWVRVFVGPVDLRWFGAKAVAAFDNLAAWNAFHAYLDGLGGYAHAVVPRGEFETSGAWNYYLRRGEIDWHGYITPYLTYAGTLFEQKANPAGNDPLWQGVGTHARINGGPKVDGKWQSEGIVASSIFFSIWEPEINNVKGVHIRFTNGQEASINLPRFNFGIPRFNPFITLSVAPVAWLGTASYVAGDTRVYNYPVYAAGSFGVNAMTRRTVAGTALTGLFSVTSGSTVVTVTGSTKLPREILAYRDSIVLDPGGVNETKSVAGFLDQNTILLRSSASNTHVGVVANVSKTRNYRSKGDATSTPPGDPLTTDPASDFDGWERVLPEYFTCLIPHGDGATGRSPISILENNRTQQLETTLPGTASCTLGSTTIAGSGTDWASFSAGTGRFPVGADGLRPAIKITVGGATEALEVVSVTSDILLTVRTNATQTLAGGTLKSSRRFWQQVYAHDAAVVVAPDNQLQSIDNLKFGDMFFRQCSHDTLVRMGDIWGGTVPNHEFATVQLHDMTNVLIDAFNANTAHVDKAGNRVILNMPEDSEVVHMVNATRTRWKSGQVRGANAPGVVSFRLGTQIASKIDSFSYNTWDSGLSLNSEADRAAGFSIMPSAVLNGSHYEGEINFIFTGANAFNRNDPEGLTRFKYEATPQIAVGQDHIDVTIFPPMALALSVSQFSVTPKSTDPDGRYWVTVTGHNAYTISTSVVAAVTVSAFGVRVKQTPTAMEDQA